MNAMTKKGWRVIAVAPLDNYSSKFSANGIMFLPMAQSRKVVSPFQDMQFALRLIRLYRKERPDLVHHFTIKPVIYGSIAAGIAKVRAIIIAVTGLGYMFMTQGVKGKGLKVVVSILYKIALSGKAKLVIFQNPEDHETFLSKRLLKKEKAFVIRGSGVDVKRFVPSGDRKGDPVILLAARMLWAKGIGELILAARLLHEWKVPCKVVLAGKADPGNPTSISEAELRKMNSEGVVSWIGHHEDIEKIYGTADIVVLPSYYPEGVPKNLIEAAACGLPLVATDVPGCREVVRHGENGLLVPVKDSQALAIALKTLIEDKDLRARMGKRSREIAVAEFSQEKIISETLSVYERVLNQSI